MLSTNPTTAELGATMAGIGVELRRQDDMGFAQPAFCVFEKERIYGMRFDYADDFAWRSEDGESFAEGDAYEDGDEPVGWEKVAYVERERFVAPFFTRAAAEDYVAANAHNLNSPSVIVVPLDRCREMVAIRRFLMDLPEPEEAVAA